MIVNDTASVRRTAAVLAVVLGVLQLALVPNIGIAGGRANLALVFVACACFGGDIQSAPAAGFVAGLFYDLTSSGPIGLMALLLTACGWLMAVSGKPQVSEDPLSTVANFAPYTLGVGLVYGVVLLVSGQASSVVDVLLLRALPGCALDCMWLLVVSWLLSRTGAQGPRGLSLSGGKGKGSKGRSNGHYKLGKGL